MNCKLFSYNSKNEQYKFWWVGMDSNHYSIYTTDLQSATFTNRRAYPIFRVSFDTYVESLFS